MEGFGGQVGPQAVFIQQALGQLAQFRPVGASAQVLGLPKVGRFALRDGLQQRVEAFALGLKLGRTM